jgi:hypothetical protein
MTAEQLTLAGLLDELAKVPQDAIVKLAGFGFGNTPGKLFRHRPYLDGLSIMPSPASRTDREPTASEYSGFLRQNGPGTTWEKVSHPDFKDLHPASMDSPMWVGFPHEIGFNAVTSVEMIKGFAVIRTVITTPVHGPSLQRIPDAEVIERMQAVSLALHGDRRDIGPEAAKALIRYIPKDRTTVRLDLEEARWDLDKFEASLQAKKDRVAKLEADAARHDYLLGITNELPASPTKES